MSSALPSTAMRLLGALAIGASAATLAPPLGAQAAASGAPTVAVLYFTNSALVNHDQYAPLSKGIADMLVTQLAQNPALRVVERDRLQSILEELDLHQSERVDDQTAVQIGKVLGVRHMLMGGFVIDMSQTMRLDIRAVNVETSQVEYVETVQGKSENVLALIADLGRRVNSGLRLPAMPASRGQGQSQQGRQTSDVSPADQYRAFFLVSKSIEEQDRKNFPGAIALLREALQVYPEFERAKVRLATLERGESE